VGGGVWGGVVAMGGGGVVAVGGGWVWDSARVSIMRKIPNHFQRCRGKVVPWSLGQSLEMGSTDVRWRFFVHNGNKGGLGSSQADFILIHEEGCQRQSFGTRFR